MNFLEALEKCYDGFKIRKSTWGEDDYLKHEDYIINLYVKGVDGFITYRPYMRDLLKTDWEIYEEVE